MLNVNTAKLYFLIGKDEQILYFLNRELLKSVSRFIFGLIAKLLYFHFLKNLNVFMHIFEKQLKTHININVFNCVRVDLK